MKIPQVSISKDSLTLNYSLDEHHSLYLLLHLEGKEGKCHNTCYNPYNMLVWYKALIFELQGNRRALTLLPILGTARLYHQRCKWKFSSLQQCDLFPAQQGTSSNQLYQISSGCNFFGLIGHSGLLKILII